MENKLILFQNSKLNVFYRNVSIEGPRRPLFLTLLTIYHVKSEGCRESRKTTEILRQLKFKNYRNLRICENNSSSFFRD